MQLDVQSYDILNKNLSIIEQRIACSTPNASNDLFSTYSWFWALDLHCVFLSIRYGTAFDLVFVVHHFAGRVLVYQVEHKMTILDFQKVNDVILSTEPDQPVGLGRLEHDDQMLDNAVGDSGRGEVEFEVIRAEEPQMVDFTNVARIRHGPRLIREREKIDDTVSERLLEGGRTINLKLAY